MHRTTLPSMKLCISIMQLVKFIIAYFEKPEPTMRRLCARAGFARGRVATRMLTWLRRGEAEVGRHLMLQLQRSSFQGEPAPPPMGNGTETFF